MTYVKSENQIKYEALLSSALMKARLKFKENKNIKLDSLDKKISDACGISFEDYRNNTLTDLITEAAQSANKSYQDFCLEMVLNEKEIKEIKDLEILVIQDLT